MTTETIKDAATLRAELAHYCGGDQPYKHSLNRKFCYTEGVRHFARNAGNQGAYWFLDILAFEPRVKQLVMVEGFALVLLSVSSDNSATIEVKADSDEAPTYSQSLEYTDCPEGEWKFYIEPTYVGADLVTMMMLPQER